MSLPRLLVPLLLTLPLIACADPFDITSTITGLPGIRVESVRQHTPRGVINPVGAERLFPGGPMHLIPGEAVGLTYSLAWTIAYAEGDPSKPVNKDYLSNNAFLYVSGDPRKSVVVEFKSGQKATITKPTNNGSAPVNPLIGLAPYNTIAGRTMKIIQNRLAAPTKIDHLPNGGQVWHYHKEIQQTAQRIVTTSGQVTGFVGDEMVNLNTNQQTYVAVARPLVLWDFSIVFGADGLVESVSNGTTGPGQWSSPTSPK